MTQITRARHNTRMNSDKKRSSFADFLEGYARRQGLVRRDGTVNATQLARAVGLNQPTVHRLLQGENQPSYETIETVAARLGISAWEMIDEHHETAPPDEAAITLARKIQTLAPEVRDVLERQVALFIASSPAAASRESGKSAPDQALDVRRRDVVQPTGPREVHHRDGIEPSGPREVRIREGAPAAPGGKKNRGRQ